LQDVIGEILATNARIIKALESTSPTATAIWKKFANGFVYVPVRDVHDNDVLMSFL